MPTAAEQFLQDYQPAGPQVPRGQTDPTEFLKDYTPEPAASNAQMGGPLREPALAGSSALTGLENLAGSAGGLREAAQGLGSHFGVPPWLTGGIVQGLLPFSALPSSQAMARFTDELGLTGRRDLVPQNPAERFGSAAVESLPSALPMLATGVGVPAALGSALFGGLGGEAGRELTGGSTAGALAGGLLGGSAVGALSSMSRLGQLERAAAELGTSSTLQSAGERLQDEARSWANGVFPAKEEAAWAPVDQLVPRGTPVPLDEFQARLEALANRGGNYADVVKHLSPRLPAVLLKQLDRNPEGLSSEDLESPAPAPRTPPSWQEARVIRSSLGAAMKDPQVIKDLPQSQISSLYQAITQDLKDAAEGVSPEALDAFEAANAESSRLRGIADGPIQRILDKTPESSAGGLISEARKGGTTLADLRGEIPTGVDELASSIIRQDQWKKMSPEAKRLLVQDPVLRNQIETAPPRSTSPMLQTASSAKELLGAFLGEKVGEMATLPLHLSTNPIALGGAGALVGAVAPWAARAALGALRRPNELLYPATGGLAASGLTLGGPRQ